MSLKVISWNVGGASKLKSASAYRSWLATAAIILLQETFAATVEKLPKIRNFSVYSCDATPRVGKGRPTGGVATYLHQDVLGTFHVEELKWELPFPAVVLQLDPKSHDRLSILLVNVYAQTSNCADSDLQYDLLLNAVSEHLMDRHCIDVILGGDFNGHLEAPHPQPAALSQNDEAFRDFARILDEEGFTCFPDRRCAIPTYVTANASTTIDFIFCRGVAVEARVTDRSLALHRPIEAVVNSAASPPICRLKVRTSSRRLPIGNGGQKLARCIKLFQDSKGIISDRLEAIATFFMVSILSYSRAPTPTQPRKSWHRYLTVAQQMLLNEMEDLLDRMLANLSGGADTLAYGELRKKYHATEMELHRAALAKLNDEVRMVFFSMHIHDPKHLLRITLQRYLVIRGALLTTSLSPEELELTAFLESDVRALH